MIRIGLLIIILLSGCREFNLVNNLKPGKSVKLDNIRYNDLTFHCDVSRDHNRPHSLFSSSDVIFQEAYADLTSARLKWTYRRVLVRGDVFFTSGKRLSMQIGEPLRDTEHPGELYLVEANVTLKSNNKVDLGEAQLYGTIVFLEDWNIIWIDNAELVK